MAFKHASSFSLTIKIALGLLISLVITFVLYVNAEKQIDRANELRHQSFLLADELRQSSDDLTRMVRSYVATGNPMYKASYQEILAIRDGKVARPNDYQNIYWDLVLIGQRPVHTPNEPYISLLELMRKTHFTEQELGILRDAKSKSDALTATEVEAMQLIDLPGQDLDTRRLQALTRVFGANYDQAKAAIMQPIGQFYELMSKRTDTEVKNAAECATLMRMLLIGAGLSLLFSIWRINQILYKTMGGSVQEVYAQISRIGKDDFVTNIDDIAKHQNDSILGWLAETQHNLKRLRDAREQAEADKQESDARYRTLFNSARVGINIFSDDPKQPLIDANPWLCQLLGYSVEELRQLLPQDVVAAAELIHINRAIDTIANGHGLLREWQLKRKDGSTFPAEIISTHISDGLLMSVVIDITERKRVEESLRHNERFITTLAHNIPGMVAHWTKDLWCDFANKEYLNWFGKTAEEIHKLKPWEVVGEELYRLNEGHVHAALGGEAQSFERTLQRPDGIIVHVWTQFIPDFANNEVIGFFVVMLNITARKEAELALRESVQHTQAVLDNMFDGVITINTRGTIESFNKAAARIFGYSAEEVLGNNVTRLMPESLRSQHGSYLARHLATPDLQISGALREVNGQRKDGSLFPMSLSISKIAQAGRATFVGLVRDITEQRKHEDEIYRLAFYDPLTNLPNRRLLFDRLQQAMITSSRTNQHGSLMFLDLDHFKQLNDSLGHDLGDVLLQQVAARLHTCIRAGDSVARMGGDEFVVLIEELNIQANDAASQAETIANKVLTALGKPYQLREHTYVITPSIGIVMFLHQNDTVDELLKKADVAMYQAKAAGRNNARFFDPTMQAAASVRIELEKNLRQALEKQEFTLYYQLQVDAHNAPTGVEALIRWHHGKHGAVSPAAFIPLAEETGMILAIGQWVLETACAQLTKWASDAKKAHWTMAVNVSASQFAQPDFVANVTQALQKTGANPNQLKLELTESMLVKDLDDVIVKMSTIKALGVTFSLDDFGTGYSSLSYLKRLPLDQLKIDQSFVRDLLSDPNDATIASTIIALGHSLSLRVIAEGVETQEQRDALATMGCDAYQGYYFARPVAVENLENCIGKLPR